MLGLERIACYLPHFHTLFSPDALGGRDLFAGKFRDDHYYWSLLRVLPDGWGPQVVFAVWIGMRPVDEGLARALLAGGKTE